MGNYVSGSLVALEDKRQLFACQAVSIWIMLTLLTMPENLITDRLAISSWSGNQIRWEPIILYKAMPIKMKVGNCAIITTILLL